MRIALMNEFSQASKNAVVLEQLEAVGQQQGHEIFNVGMKDDDDHRLTYIHLGIISALLLNSKAVDFVVSGCGTGQGALMSLNAYPGVVCGYCIDPADAYLFAQINDGNALALPFAKGFGWGAELNVRYIFENANAVILNDVKAATNKPIVEALKALPEDLVKQAVGGAQFQECFFSNSQSEELSALVKSWIS